MKDIQTMGLNLKNGVYYWGEVSNDWGNNYVPLGTGVYVKPDKSFNMTEYTRNENYEGLFMHRAKDYTEESYMTNIKNGKICGPYMAFIYEKYVKFSTVNENGKYNGYYMYCDYSDGSYIIGYYDNGNLRDKGLYFKDGYLQFITFDSNNKINGYLSKIYIGSEYRFTPYRLFMMPFEKNRDIETLDYYNDGCVGKVQSIAREFNGYGILRWANGSSYFGEFMADARSGMGCYRFKEGDIIIGKFYDNSIYGTAMYCYSNGGISRGHFTKGKQDGTFFDTFADNNLFRIARFSGSKLIGRSYYINPNDFKVMITSEEGKVLETRYFG